MRRVLVDFARNRNRKGKIRLVSLDEDAVIPGNRAIDLVTLDEALKALAELDPRQSQIVELRFFGGLTVKETAEVLEISTITVIREWNKAKAWLYLEMRGKTDER
jgi:RNA polymerase sigma factor (TIGR02999 family)